MDATGSLIATVVGAGVVVVTVDGARFAKAAVANVTCRAQCAVATRTCVVDVGAATGGRASIRRTRVAVIAVDRQTLAQTRRARIACGALAAIVAGNRTC